MFEHTVKFEFNRKFGFELEYMNPPTTRSSMKRVIETESYFSARTTGWEHSRNNTDWVCKTDSSASIEVATSVMSTKEDLKTACHLVDKFKEKGFWFDDRCGQHTHVSDTGFSDSQIDNLIGWWIKTERLFLNTVPSARRCNTYCPLSNSYIVSGRVGSEYHYRDALSAIKSNLRHNRGSLNLPNLSRPTFEFRFGSMVEDSKLLLNRIRMQIYFVEMCRKLPAPITVGWMTPSEFFKTFGLLQIPNSDVKLKFTSEIQEMKKCFLEQFIENADENKFHRDIAICRGLLEKMEYEEVVETESQAA